MQTVSTIFRFRATAAAAVIGCAAAASPALAADNAHDPHVHGLALMNVAIDGGVVEIEMDVPGADIVGFEHAPSSQMDKAAIAAATEKLRAGRALFRFPDAAKCRMEHAEVEDPETPDPAEKGPAHMEFEAQYKFACANPAAVTWIEVGLFKAFPSLKEIEVQLLSPRGQTATELTPEKPRFSF